jgi:hypothetical protein
MTDLFVSGGIVTALEQAAIAVGRLDASLTGNPLRRAWTFWSELDTARRHAETDGRKIDLFRLAAHLHGLPLRLGDTTSAPERGREIASLNYAVELRSWMAAPDAEQQRLRDIALDSLQDCGGGQPALVATAQGMLTWLAGRGSRPAIRAAVPLYLRDRAITIHALAAITGGDALRAGPDGAFPRCSPARGCGWPRPAADDGAGVARGPASGRSSCRRPVEFKAARRSRSAGRLAAAQHFRPGRGAELLGRGRVADAGSPGPA